MSLSKNEAYTSKLCSRCGKYNDCGDSKIYHCEGCGIVVDRDVNAGKSIGMRGMKKRIR